MKFTLRNHLLSDNMPYWGTYRFSASEVNDYRRVRAASYRLANGKEIDICQTWWDYIGSGPVPTGPILNSKKSLVDHFWNFSLPKGNSYSYTLYEGKAAIDFLDNVRIANSHIFSSLKSMYMCNDPMAFNESYKIVCRLLESVRPDRDIKHTCRWFTEMCWMLRRLRRRHLESRTP
jgi:hypothetical protein